MEQIEKYIKRRIEKDLVVGISFVGDSITSAEWVHPNYRDIVEYVLKDRFHNSWNIQVFNNGFDGSTSQDILKRVDDYILPLRPNIVIYEIGVNDGAFQVTVETFEDNILLILNKLKTVADYVYLVTAPLSLSDKINKRYKPYLNIIKKLGVDSEIPVSNLNRYFKYLNLGEIYTFMSEDNPVEGLRKGQLDPEHPNILGNAYIAKYLLQDIWGIDFDVKKYMESLRSGLKYPQY